MTQKRVRRRSHSTPQLDTAPRQRRQSERSPGERRPANWRDLRGQDASRAAASFLSHLIEQNAPLNTHTSLVLMYGPFQAEMGSSNRQGVASWLQECVRKHGLPSLVRFDHRQRAQVFRRDQFQSLLEPLLSQNAS